MKTHNKKMTFAFLTLFALVNTGSLVAKETTGDKIDRAIEKAEEAVRSTKETVKDWASDAQEKSKALGEKIKDQVRDTKEKVQDWAKDAKDKASDAAREVKRQLKEARKESKHTTVTAGSLVAKETAGDKIDRAIEEAEEAVRCTKETVKDWASDAQEKSKALGEKIKDQVRDTKEKVQDWAKDAKDKASDAAREVKRQLKEAKKESKHAARDPYTST